MKNHIRTGHPKTFGYQRVEDEDGFEVWESPKGERFRYPKGTEPRMAVRRK